MWTRTGLELIFGAVPRMPCAARMESYRVRWGRVARAHQADKPPRLALHVKLLVVSIASFMLTACQAASSPKPAPSEPVSAGTLTREFQESATDARRKYDGKEITVKGLTVMTPMMPPASSDQGLVLLEETRAKPPRRVSCWFSNDQADQFSKIKGGQLITVKGIFNGEAGAELKFCRLVKIE